MRRSRRTSSPNAFRSTSSRTTSTRSFSSTRTRPFISCRDRQHRSRSGSSCSSDAPSVWRGIFVRLSPGTRVVVNGGNCNWPDINWVHYVHHAWTEVEADAPLWFKLKHQTFSAAWRHRERAALNNARIIIANSDLTRAHLIQHFRLPPDRIKTVYLGADRSWGLTTIDERATARRWLAIPDSRPVVAFIGALGFDGRKGFDTLWHAWRELCAGPEWDAALVVAGGGHHLKDLALAVEAAGLAPRVRILGPTDRIRDVLAAVDLLVSPARYEAYGLNVHEAICRGVPAMVSRQAGIAERFPPELSDLLLSDPANVGDLVTKLRVWRPQLEAWKGRIRAFGDKLREYTWNDMARAFVTAIEQQPAREELRSGKW